MKAKAKKGKKREEEEVEGEAEKEEKEKEEEEAAASAPPAKKRRKKADPEAGASIAEGGTEGAERPADAEAAGPAEEVTGSLLHLRSLLTPAGFAEPSLATAPPSSEPAAQTEGEGAGGAPPLLDWTSRYFVVDASDASTSLEDLAVPLQPAMEEALRGAGFKKLFPIQAAVIPLLARSAETAYDEDSPYCCDVCVAAPTGQGKTLAYAVPLVQALLSRTVPQPRAVVVLPTRDLAIQVYRVFELLRHGLGLGVAQVRARCLTGQKSFAEEQRSLERSPPDVVVCTPGRLADHVLGRTARLGLGALRWFVADEADRLLTQGYHRWLDVLERASSSARGEGRPRLQKLLLSATMTWNPQKLAMLRLHRPIYFFSSQTGKHATPAELQQHYMLCTLPLKPLAVLYILGRMLRGELGSQELCKAVVFCPSVDTSRRLARLLKICCAHSQAPCHGKPSKEEPPDPDSEQGPTLLLEPNQIEEFSSNLLQRERTIMLRRFRKGQLKCLVCSDVAARGIDIPAVNVVINYSTPSRVQTYIHRVGRTARAGRTGHTFTLVRNNEMLHFKRMIEESADGWSRLQKDPLPKFARQDKEEWFAGALGELEQQLEEGGRKRRQEESGGKQPSDGEQEEPGGEPRSEAPPQGERPGEKPAEEEEGRRPGKPAEEGKGRRPGKAAGEEKGRRPGKARQGKAEGAGAKREDAGQKASGHSTPPARQQGASEGQGGGTLLDFARSLRRLRAHP